MERTDIWGIYTEFRDDQTSAADSIDPETKTREKSLISFFKEKIKQLTTDLRFAQGEASYYKDEVGNYNRIVWNDKLSLI